MIVVGREHNSRWGTEGSKSQGRVVEADNIGIDLGRAVAEVRKLTHEDSGQ